MSTEHKSLAQAVSDSRSRTGAKQTTLTFSAEEMELLERLAASTPYGTKKAAIMAGLRALDRGSSLTDEEIIAELARRLGR